jgi:hypothetical protein
MLNRLPIPRLPDRHAHRKPGRVSRACDECRSQKRKCDGYMPTCGQCASAKLAVCVYSKSKRDRERNELELAKEKTDRYERLLREASHEVELPLAKRIERALVCSSYFVYSDYADWLNSNLHCRDQHLRKMEACP